MLKWLWIAGAALLLYSLYRNSDIYIQSSHGPLG